MRASNCTRQSKLTVEVLLSDGQGCDCLHYGLHASHLWWQALLHLYRHRVSACQRMAVNELAMPRATSLHFHPRITFRSGLVFPWPKMVAHLFVLRFMSLRYVSV